MVWEFGQNTLSLTPDLAARLGLSSSDPRRIDITTYRDRIAPSDLQVVYERLARSFLRSEPMVNVYGLRLGDGSVVRVRSVSRWEMNRAGEPTLFVAVIKEIESQVHSMVEDEFIERIIELRFLAERLDDKRFRQIVDTMLQEVWQLRRPA
ncbi:hypothetical protein D3218_03875 [Aureimonas flava]|uniref:Uncharacterized protein n=1 Tax=Aureimonas flava TaxID=2320271 RepID=A0A3A1WN64_9HYPH|nr:hypothetical protein D3218_03875 [Aureimonas flava]